MEYCFVFGDEVDGVILYLLLVMFNVLFIVCCEWLVLGLFGEKVVELICGLFKVLCCNFVFVLDFVCVFVEVEVLCDELLGRVLVVFFKCVMGVEVIVVEFVVVELLVYFFMCYCLYDDSGCMLVVLCDFVVLCV